MTRMLRSPRGLRLSAFLFLLAAASTHAEDAGTQPHPGGMHPPGPPPEALAACSGQAAGADCRFTDRGGNTRSGTCLAAHAPPGASSDAAATTTALACDDPNHPHGPPPDGATRP